MALKRVWIPSPNYSGRGGATPRLLVLHTAEGARTIESLGSFFQGNVQASSHVGADDKPNTVGEYVRRDSKAWTCANYNPVSVNIELCGFASWTAKDWEQHPNMLANCAQWIAEEAAHYGIPIQKLTAGEAQGSGRGVCQHADLGAGGGGHWDCGSGFPIDQVISMARGNPPPAPTPPPPEDTVSIAVGSMKDGRPEVFVHLENGEVKHTWVEKDGSWHGAEKGKAFAKWEPLGSPGK